MKNKYVNFISDEHLLQCIANLHNSYLKAKAGISKRKFYSNKIDTFKLTFDSKFNKIDEKNIIETEILRQIDKSINNSIGRFHEEILAGIPGYEMGNLSGFDIRAMNNTLFADIKNKHNTMNSSSAESLFQKLAKLADENKKAKCYWVQMLAKSSFTEKWMGDINGKEYSHSRVYKISGDQFYSLLTGKEDSLIQLYRALPKAIDDFMQTIGASKEMEENSAFKEIKNEAEQVNRNILDQITFENYRYYLGFAKL